MTLNNNKYCFSMGEVIGDIIIIRSDFIAVTRVINTRICKSYDNNYRYNSRCISTEEDYCTNFKCQKSIYYVPYYVIHKLFTTMRFVSLNALNNVGMFRFLAHFVRTTNKLSFSTVPMAETNLKTFKISSPEFKSIFTNEVQALAALFEEQGYELRIAGGAVRDLLMNKLPHDLDFATTATPDEMKEIFESKNIRMVNNKGEKHGTITPRINDKENFEVTTLRIDIRTYGRKADVEFTKDWKLDANRRDLTINSMFLGLDGTVYDYFDGYNDLINKRINFVGDPIARIQEDYLRILRYFRFYGKISDNPDNHDQKILNAIQDNAKGMEQISGERIWGELSKILQGNFAGELMLKMLSLGIGHYIGMPPHPNISEFETVWERGKNSSLKSMTLLSALFRNQNEVMCFNERVKLSAYDRELGFFILEHREEKVHIDPLRPYQGLILNSKLKISDVKDFVKEVLKYNGKLQLLSELEGWSIPRFPINGNMLKDAKVPGGRLMGTVIQKLKEQWIESGFSKSSEELLLNIPKILDEINTKKKKPEHR